MKKLALVFLLLSMAIQVASQPVVTPPSFIPGLFKLITLPTGDVFHYISATGNDSHDGLTPATAWKTPNHSLNCGDFIIVLGGSYSTAGFFDHITTTPSNCPSTTGGIDGTGGLMVAGLVCGASDLTGCNITCPGLNCGTDSQCQVVEFDTGASNWVISGFNINSTAACRGIEVMQCQNSVTCPTTPYLSHHIAIVNTIVSDSRIAFGGNDEGQLRGDGTSGFDYLATVAMIGQRANQEGNFNNGICDSQIDLVGLANHDTTAGNHAYAYNNYLIEGIVTGCDAHFDGEAIMVDSPDVHLFGGIGMNVVIANNIGYHHSRYCISMTKDIISNKEINWKVYNNTCYDNNQGVNTMADAAGADMNEFGNGGSFDWNFSVYNNIFLTQSAFVNSVPLFPMVAGGATWNMWVEGTAVGTGKENVFKGQYTGACGNCAPSTAPFAEAYFNGNPIATNTQNTFTDPSFANTADLPNHLGTANPNCTGFQTTTACMGYNPTTRVLTPNTLIADFQASCAGCSGKGFQLPSTTCASNADYPSWLKGVGGGLYWDGTKLWERSDVVTKPCNM